MKDVMYKGQKVHYLDVDVKLSVTVYRYIINVFQKDKYEILVI